MKRALGQALSAAVTLVLLAAFPAPAQAGRVVLVGIDGASWRVIDAMRANGALPRLDALITRGITAELETVEPVISPVVWTSLATGRVPAAHGVGGFLATRLDLAVPTVFDRLAGAGRRVGLFEYLVSWPPPAFPDGFVAPAWMRRDTSLWPTDLFARAGLSPWRFDHPRPAFSREEAIAEIRAELVHKPAIFRRLIETYQPDVAATVIYGVDRTSHRFWREAYPADFAGGGARSDAPAPGSKLEEIMLAVDAAVGAIGRALGPDDVLMIASDHGFQADPDRDDGIWVGRTGDRLGAADLEGERDGFTVIREWGVIVVRIHEGPFAARDAVQDRLVRFYEAITDAQGEPLLRVFQLDEAPRPDAARRSWLERATQWGLRFVARRFFGAEFDVPAHGWVIARFRDDRMTALGPDATIRVAGRPVRAGEVAFAERFDGTHHPTAVFIAAGGPLRALEARQRLSVLDVAPLITYLAGEAIPDDLEGELPASWIGREHFAAHPPREISAANAPGLIRSGSGAGPATDEDAMVERLRALGYVR